MYLQEIAKDSNIQLVIGIGQQILTFETRVCEAIPHGIYAQPVKKDDKIIGFQTKGLVITIYCANSDDKKVYEWKHVKLQNIKTPDEKIYLRIMSNVAGKLVNRRYGCRVWIGLDGVAQIGTNRTAHDVIIKDISINGISFVCGKDIKAEVGEVTHIHFFDDVLKVKFSLGAIIVRSEETEDGKVVFGCRLNQESNAIAKYVNDKQREKLKATRSVDLKDTNNKDKESQQTE